MGREGIMRATFGAARRPGRGADRRSIIIGRARTLRRTTAGNREEADKSNKRAARFARGATCRPVAPATEEETVSRTQS